MQSLSDYFSADFTGLQNNAELAFLRRLPEYYGARPGALLPVFRALRCQLHYTSLNNRIFI